MLPMQYGAIFYTHGLGMAWRNEIADRLCCWNFIVNDHAVTDLMPASPEGVFTSSVKRKIISGKISIIPGKVFSSPIAVFLIIR